MYVTSNEHARNKEIQWCGQNNEILCVITSAIKTTYQLQHSGLTSTTK